MVVQEGAIAGCGRAWYQTGQVPVPSHNFAWIAPNATGCVTFSIAQAGGASDAYNTARVRLLVMFCQLSGNQGQAHDIHELSLGFICS